MIDFFLGKGKLEMFNRIKTKRNDMNQSVNKILEGIQYITIQKNNTVSGMVKETRKNKRSSTDIKETEITRPSLILWIIMGLPTG